MNRGQLILAIKREARVKNSTNLDTMIGEMLDDVLTDYTNRAYCYELFQPETPIVLTNAIGTYDLPADFANLKEVRYGVTATNNESFRVIKPLTEVVRRTNPNGYPFHYFLSAGPQINLFPYKSILSTDTLVIDYYINPLSIFSVDADPMVITRLQSAIKKEVIMRIDRFHADTQGEQMTAADARASFEASQAATK